MPEPRPMCPFCGEDVLVEHDPISRRWFCIVCGRDWREVA